MNIKTRLFFSIFTIAAVFILAPIAQSASPSPFVGEWQAIDVDGSDIRLTIAGRPTGPFQITWTESYISFCNGEAGIVRGTGWLNESDPNLLEADLRVDCFTTGASLVFHVTWVYDPGTDTISNGVTTWHRPGHRGGKCLPPPAGLSGWWPGDGNANDIISGRNGILHGDATTGSGLVDLAFSLDGEDDFVDVPDAPGLNFGPGNFTVDLWVNFNDISGEQVLVEKWIQGDGYVNGWTLTKLENQILRLAMDDGTGNEIDLDSEELTILPGVWYHFAATRQGSEVTLFVNGLPVAHNPEMGSSNLYSESSLKFGHRGVSEDTPGSVAGGGFYLNGRIDEVELFVGTALSEEQVMGLYTAGSAGKCKDEIQTPPTIGLRVNYGHDWVESSYEAGHTVWISVMESDGVTVKATAEVVTEPKDFWGGETGFTTSPENWVPAPPDIQPYDWVYAWADNGASAQVQIGDIQGEVYIMEDRIAGTIEAPWITDPVPVECLDWGSGGGPFNKDAGSIYTNGTDLYNCSWDPDSEWDLQAWQDVGVGYFTPDGHWVANVFQAEHWAAMWTYDLPAGFWSEGEHSYYFKWAYTVPEQDGITMDPMIMTVSGSSAGVETPIYPGYVLIQPWSSTPQLAWTGSACEVVPVIHPDQPTRFVWGWVNDYSMSYEEALAHFTSFTVEAYWDGETGGSAQMTMGELIPFTGAEARWDYRCSLTEHPPKLDLRVNYGHDWVESFYEAGHMVQISVTDSNGAVKATAEVVTEPKDFWGGETGFQTNPEDWVPSQPDIQPYDQVYAWVDNRASAQVQIGEISGEIDLSTDSIQGTINASWFSSEVNVECHPWGSPEPVDMKFDTVLPDGEDPYSCSWAGEWDIQPGQDVGVGYFGLDGHWVANAFFIPNTYIVAFP